MKIINCGDRAVLVECADAATARTLRRQIAERWPTVLGANTVLVRASAAEVRAVIASAASEPAAETAEVRPQRTHRIGVHYDGPDLAFVSQVTGLSVKEVITAHTSRPWRVSFAGFAPGFAYLTDGDLRLQVPRLASPRTRVPAGAVGLAGQFSGIYPRESAGGWPLLGHTDTPLWDVAASPPALLQPGDQVLFEAR